MRGTRAKRWPRSTRRWPAERLSWAELLKVIVDDRARLWYIHAALFLDPWCSGQTCGPVKAEIAGSNPVGSAWFSRQYAPITGAFFVCRTRDGRPARLLTTLGPPQVLNSPAMLSILLLGAPAISVDGRPLDTLRRKNRALVYYLARRVTPVTRDEALAFLWPDHPRPAALHSLRSALSELRRQLGPALLVEADSLALGPETQVDTWRFEAAIAAAPPDLAALSMALELYRGEFLQGFSLAEPPEFDDWVAEQREHFRALAVRGLAALSQLQQQQHDHAAALEALNRALAFEPLREDLQRAALRLHYRLGDRAGAIRRYEALRRQLDEELGVPPSPETRALYDSLINDTFVPVTSETTGHVPTIKPSADKPLLPLLGRDAELETLKSHLGSGRFILLEGEPGIGKTRLISELIASQTQGKTSVLVLRGTSFELEQGMPYQPIVDSLRKLLADPERKPLFGRLNLEPVWLTELARLLPELLTQLPHIPAPAQPADERRLWEALHQFFRALAGQAKVWLFLDDLHWADAATIAWLGYLIRNLSTPAFNVLATSRPLERQTDLIKLLQALSREHRLPTIQLSILSKSVMQEMAAIFSQKNNYLLSDWLIKNPEDNPFFITELVRYAQGIGLLKRDGMLDTELLDLSPAIPATIQNLIETRLLKLSEKARRLLHVAAIIGREFDFELAKQVASMSEIDTLDAVDELQAAHLIRPLFDDKFAFDHSLTMEVSLTDMNATRRRSIHRQVAEVLESNYQGNLDPVSGLIALHFMDGNDSDRAKFYVFRAGQLAANLAAWVEALAFYKQALELEAVDTERAPIFLAMGTAHIYKGDYPLAAEDFRSALALAEASRNLPLLEEAHLGLVRSVFPLQAYFSEAVETSKKLRESGPPELAVCAEFVLGTSLAMDSAHPVEAEYHLHEAERLLRDRAGIFDTKVTNILIKYQLGAVLGQQGRNEEAYASYREVLDLMERGEGTLDQMAMGNIMLYNHLAYYAHLLGNASAAGYAQTGIELARERGRSHCI